MTAWESYRDVYTRAIQGEEFRYPIHIEIENIYACNLACVHCAREYVPGSTEIRRMDADLYAKIVTEAVRLGTRSLGFAVWGEVLMDKTILEKIRFAKDAGIIDIRLHTNGILVTEEMADKLVRAGVTWCSVSLDALTPETYAKVRGGDFDKACNAIWHLLDAKEREQSDIHLRVSFVKCALNQHEVNAFTWKWSQFCEVCIQDFYDPSGILPAHLALPESDAHRPTQCFENFYKVFIRHDGTVVPCCEDIQNQIMLGNIRTQSLEEIYNGLMAKALRRQHKSQQVTNPTCRQCLKLDVRKELPIACEV